MVGLAFFLCPNWQIKQVSSAGNLGHQYNSQEITRWKWNICRYVVLIFYNFFMANVHALRTYWIREGYKSKGVAT